MYYDNESLEELCSNIDLLDYAESEGYEFKRMANNKYFTNCPLHVDVTPSLCIDTTYNNFKCFSCGVRGRIIDWCVGIDKNSFPDAVSKLSEMSGMKVNAINCELMSFYKKMEHRNKKEKKEFQRTYLDPYAYERYDEEVPEEWVSEGISEKAMKHYEIRVDHSSNRIIYPIYDNDFRLIGIKGRTRYPNYKELGIMKYMNYYKVGGCDFFVGMKQAIDYIKEKNEVIVFEGIKSCMKAYDYGYYNCVASETSSINDEQVKLLVKMRVKDVVVAYDSDVDISKIRENMKKLQRFCNVYVVDSHGLGNKMSPVDAGKETWDVLYLSKKRI